MKHEIDITRELLATGRAEANQFANEDRYRAARNMLALYGDVLTASELRNDYNEPIIRLKLIREAMK